MTKSTSVFLFFLFFNTMFCLAQDTIVKKNGDSMIVAIEDESVSWIRYKDFYFLDGPYRSIQKYKVSKIIYSKNKIDLSKGVIEKQVDSLIKLSRDPLYGKGFYVEFSPGYSHLDKLSNSSKGDYVGGGIRLGTKWYFGKYGNSRHGITMSWIKCGYYANNQSSNFLISAVNPGYTGVYKFKQDNAIETTLNFGFAAANNTEFIVGIMVDPGLYYRKKNWSVGIMYSFMYGSKISIVLWGGTSDYWRGIIHTYSFCVGYKF